MTIALLAKLSAIIWVAPAFAFVGILVGVVGSYVGSTFIAAQLSVKREMSNARSPVFSHFNAAIAGLSMLFCFCEGQEAHITVAQSPLGLMGRKKRSLTSLFLESTSTRGRHGHSTT